MTLTRESDHQRGLRSVVGELIEHVRHYDIPDEPSYAAFVDAWADRIHAASGVPRMQQQMAEDRKALAAVRAEQAAEVERWKGHHAHEVEAKRKTAEHNRRLAAEKKAVAAEVERLWENWYVAARAYHRSAHIPRYSTHGPWFQDCDDSLCVEARAALAATPAVAPDPAPPAPGERCEDCAGNFVDGYCRRHEPSFHGYNGAVSVPEPAP